MLDITRMINRPVAILASGVVVTGMLLCGCKSSQTPAAAATPPTTQPTFAMFGPPPDKSGVQLWSENCSRCHNMRPPEEFSAAQWSAIVHHMRLRANLTGVEQRKITEFLQASN